MGWGERDAKCVDAFGERAREFGGRERKLLMYWEASVREEGVSVGVSQLQLAAMHCNVLQHNGTYCNVLQPVGASLAATYCNVL